MKWAALCLTLLIFGLTTLDWCGTGFSYWRMPYPYGKSIDFTGGVLRVVIEYQGGMSPMLIIRDDFEVVSRSRPLEWWRWDFYEWGFTVPTWAVLLAVAAPTGLLWWRNLRRRGANVCGGCGYSLTGLPPGKPCPECGERAAHPASPAPGADGRTMRE